jgi:hypothetical protein
LLQAACHLKEAFMKLWLITLGICGALLAGCDREGTSGMAQRGANEGKAAQSAAGGSADEGKAARSAAGGSSGQKTPR